MQASGLELSNRLWEFVRVLAQACSRVLRGLDAQLYLFLVPTLWNHWVRILAISNFFHFIFIILYTKLTSSVSLMQASGLELSNRLWEVMRVLAQACLRVFGRFKGFRCPNSTNLASKERKKWSQVHKLILKRGMFPP